MVTEVHDVAVKIYWEKTNGIKRNTGTSLVTSKEVGQEVNA
jgi:hypothetical protein